MGATSIPMWNVRAHGAAGDRRTDDRAAIQAAIDACCGAGGGTVVFPAGDYLTGTVHLKDNVTLHLDAGATLWGSAEPADYDASHLICAKDVQNVSIVGQGTIDGQGEAFWVRGEGRWEARGWRPGRLLHFEGCRNVLMRDFTVMNAPAWTIHTLRCDRVKICGVTILNDILGPNTDGIDPNCSTNVHISDCHIVAGDDCIVIKATEPYPSENITVTNCTMETRCSALKLGTESHADIRHLTFSNCTIRNTNRGISIYMKDGGTIEHVLFSNITIESQATQGRAAGWPILMDIMRRSEDSKAGIIRDVKLSDMAITMTGWCVMQGMRTRPIERLSLDNVTFRVVGFDNPARRSVPSGGRTAWRDPEAGAHAAEPAHLIFANIKGLRLRDVEVIVEAETGVLERSALFGANLEDVDIRGFRGRQSVPGSPLAALRLQDCRAVRISNSRAMDGTGTFLGIEGAETADVSVVDNDLRAAAETVRLGEEVSEQELHRKGNREA